MDQSGGYTEYQFVAEFYDYVEPYQSRGDVSFYVEMALASEGRVLEIGCGTGRVLIPIARAGREITGLDLSPSMIETCRNNVSDEPEEVQKRITLLQADMRDFHIDRTFSLAIIPFRPFQHLVTVEDQRNCLNAIWRHLSPNGTFILDVFNPSLPHLTDDSYLSESGEEPEFQMPDGRTVLRRHRTVSRDLFNQINDNELIYYITHPDGREERLVHRFKMRYLFRFEAEHLLARAGFEIVEVYADYDRSLYGSKYPGELIIVSKKVNP
ncbi:MAG: methyltransferase domain-containing protein [Anaerolineales bacterium]|nr:methyltransferase domain-containing protein [Anaerolineales bacterium]